MYAVVLKEDDKYFLLCNDRDFHSQSDATECYQQHPIVFHDHACAEAEARKHFQATVEYYNTAIFKSVKRHRKAWRAPYKKHKKDLKNSLRIKLDTPRIMKIKEGLGRDITDNIDGPVYAKIKITHLILSKNHEPIGCIGEALEQYEEHGFEPFFIYSGQGFSDAFQYDGIYEDVTND